MLRTKGGYKSKPSKASLRSRGLSSNATRGQRPGSTASSVDGRYSLYSTDSEDNVAGLSRGLDKCAQLLTNILEVNTEKDTQQLPSQTRSHAKKVNFHKTRRQAGFPAASSRSDAHIKSSKPKQKRRRVVQIPTGNDVTQPEAAGGTRRVLASTPVLTGEQRKRQQQLKCKEDVLQQQIDLLQVQYDTLQQNAGGHASVPHSSSEQRPDGVKENVPEEELQQAEFLNTQQEARSAGTRKSLEFPTNAEKPFIDSQKDGTKSPLGTLKPAFRQAKKVVRIATEDCYDREEINIDTPEKFEIKERKREVLPPGQDQHRDNAGDVQHEKDEKSRKRTPIKPTNNLDEGVVQNGKDVRSKARTPPKRTPQRNGDHLRILLYLVGELKSILENIEDVEVARLLMEIENELRLLCYPVPQSPQLAPTMTTVKAVAAGKLHDIDTEVALQPLRSENSDLRRKLRITNQRLREIEIANRGEKSRQINDGLVESLHNQLLQERENFGKERQQRTILEQQLSEQVKERKRTQAMLLEKDEAISKINDKLRIQKENMATVINQMKLEVESSAISLNARDKEIALVNLALKQRDTEIERLTELTRGLQQSLSKVLTNVQGLHPDDVISEISSLHSLLDLQPALRTVDLSFAPSIEEVAQHRHEVGYPGTREYKSDTRLPLVSGDVGGTCGYNRNNYEHAVVRDEKLCSPDHVETSNMSSSFLSSSEEESTFKQELANLDDAIARLQNNLRGKL